jgi:hypothetical protein
MLGMCRHGESATLDPACPECAALARMLDGWHAADRNDRGLATWILRRVVEPRVAALPNRQVRLSTTLVMQVDLDQLRGQMGGLFLDLLRALLRGDTEQAVALADEVGADTGAVYRLAAELLALPAAATGLARVELLGFYRVSPPSPGLVRTAPSGCVSRRPAARPDAPRGDVLRRFLTHPEGRVAVPGQKPPAT